MKTTEQQSVLGDTTLGLPPLNGVKQNSRISDF
jgi:hypothetical protein